MNLNFLENIKRRYLNGKTRKNKADEMGLYIEEQEQQLNEVAGTWGPQQHLLQHLQLVVVHQLQALEQLLHHSVDREDGYYE